MSDTATRQTNGWYAPENAYQLRQQWFTPPEALNEEQLAALIGEREAITPELQANVLDEINARPTRPGGWYAPQGGLGIEPARSLGELVSSVGQSFVAEAPQPDAADDAFVDNAPVVDVDTEEAAFRQSPRLVGDPTATERLDPELPLEAQLNRGLGGLRDEPREEPVPEKEDDSLTLDDVAASRNDDGSTIALSPERGFGGVSGGEAQQRKAVTETPSALQPERGFGGVGDAPVVGGDTGPIMTASLDAQGAVSQQQQQSQQVSSASAQQPASGQPMSSSNVSVAQRFQEVEKSVQALKQQFAQGQITRNQLENELRRLMVLDEQGRWWTLGVDSKRWYRYDGREWVPDTPPQASSPLVSPQVGVANQAVQQQPRTGGTDAAALNVPTATGPQPATGNTQPDTGGTPRVSIDDYGMPLPQRVTVHDPGATAVNLNAVTSNPDEATIEKPGPRPDGAAGSESAPDSESIQQSVSPERANAAGANVTQEGALAGAFQTSPDGEASPDNYYSQQKQDRKEEPKQKSFQPDYSEALGPSFSRSSLITAGLWTGVAGLAASFAIVFCVLLAMLAYYFNTVSAYSEEIESLPDRASQFQTVEIYGQNESIQLATFNDPNRGARTRVDLEDISPWAIHALVATEDETFYENPGFSVFAILRATYTNLTSTGPRSGASTITQQLTRRLLLEEEFATEISAQRKVTEIILAAEISRQYTKNEILELYFNEMSFGGFTVGIESAAQVYFEKSASELNVFEAALLVGLVQNPALNDPFVNRENALGRMDTVLRLMTEANGDGCVAMQHTTNVSGFDLSSPLCVTNDYLVNEVPDLKAFVEGRRFEFFGTERLYDHFTLWVWDEVNRRYNDDDIFNNGFRIYTTIDADIQEIAQSTIRQQVNSGAWNANNGSAVVIDPRNGAVLAMVGSADFDNQEIDGEVNVAFTPQQPGSSIKPVVYLGALEGFPEQGEYWTAATPIWDVPTEYPSTTGGPSYVPTNFNNSFSGPVSLRYALANSLNITAVKALAYTGVDRFEEVSIRMGIDFPLQAPDNLAAALGATEVQLFDMVSAYGAFANGGVRYEPFGILRIEDINGNVIYDAFVSETAVPVQTISPQHAYIMSDMLSDQTSRAVTFGTSLVVPGYPNVAMKTGTSNDARDLLTIGWTPTVVAGVWIGNTDNSPTGAIAGSQVAAPVIIAIMQQALPSRQDGNLDFALPAGVGQATICDIPGTLVPPEGCAIGSQRSEIFIDAGVLEDWPQGQLPPDGSEGFVQSIQVDAFTNLLVNQFCPNNPVQRTFLNVEDPTAVSWIQNTAQGRNWAQQFGLDPDNFDGTLPTEECDATYVTPTAVLTGPANGQTVSQLLTFYGTAAAANFDRYELQFAPIATAENWQTLPGQAYEFQFSGQNEVLGTWNTTGAQDGQYRLRLTVFSETGASISSDPITVTVRNQTAAPSPTTTTGDVTAPNTNSNTDIPSIGESSGEAVPAGETN